jgi:hypothetical protein
VKYLALLSFACGLVSISLAMDGDAFGCILFLGMAYLLLLGYSIDKHFQR